MDTRDRCIYVFCPNDIVTGGPDALHQMVFYLNIMGYVSKIVYYAFAKSHVFSIPEPYRKYVSSFITEKDFVDDSQNIVILPEQAVAKLNCIAKSKVYIWWLSVDNNIKKSSFFWKLFFFTTLPARIIVNWDYYKNRLSEAIAKTLQAKKYDFGAEKSNIEHICASHYAYEFVSQRTQKKVSLCIEPISKLFLERYGAKKDNQGSFNRCNAILYNPKKCGKFVKRLIQQAPDLNFLPLNGLNQEQLIEKYLTSKLYIDFGPFPGAERIPKEAVLFGCCVITGRNGASNYYGDVPIPDEYKYADYTSQTSLILDKIRDVLKNYDERVKDFDIYRKTVLDLEENFMKSLRACM